MSTIHVLFIGDIVGEAGRRAVIALLPTLVQTHHLEMVIANAENAAGGAGITPKIADELFAAGIHVLTSGNHIWQKKEIMDYIARQGFLIRPLNFPAGTPGRGSCITTIADGQKIAVVNLLGRVFLDGFSCPFRAAEQEIQRLNTLGDVMVIFDFHAEATSEKQALGWFLDGRAAAVLGTHTHVQTADERVLPKGTAYITDAGMTGAIDSVIGVKTELAVKKFLTAMPVKFESATFNPYLQGVLLTLDTASQHAVQIQRLQVPLEASVEGTTRR